MSWFIYESYTQPLPIPLVTQDAPWFRHLNEPVRLKIDPRRAVALIASGLFAPVLDPKSQIVTQFESRWHYPWSEPVRVRPRLGPGLNLYNALPFPVVPLPGNQIQGWFQAWLEPVRFKPGLRIWLNQTIAYEPRLLPPVNVTGTMSATEINADIIQLGFDITDTSAVYVQFAGANVTITDIPATRSGAASISENT